MQVTVSPSNITGSITAPASKSCMQRACAAALLAKGVTTILNPGVSNDDKAALDIIRKLGAVVEDQADGSVRITSNGVNPQDTLINCGESGLSVRMFTPIAALSKDALTITGEGSLITRPVDFFDTTLPQLGVKVSSNKGRLPLNIHGPLQPTDIEVDGSLSSQFLTGLLMAFGAAATSTTTITVHNLKSKPYIDLTLQVMEAFGRKISHVDHKVFTVVPQQPAYTPHTFVVEGDWSGAAFLLVAGAIAGAITVKGLDVFSTQADKVILQALMAAGCRISIEVDKIEVGPAPLQAFHFNATDCPDLFPPLVALAAYCNGTTVIEGTSRLVHKESNRALTLQEEFAKLGVEVSLQDDLMIVRGGNVVQGANVSSRHDHRIAMACATAALKATGNVVIDSAEAVNKSYPSFCQHLQMLGATVVVN